MRTLAQPNMYWKFILVNLLLVLPNSRIFNSGVCADTPAASSTRDIEGDPLSNDDYVESIVSRLSPRQDIPQALQDNTNQQDAFQNVGSNTNDGINAEVQDPNTDQTKTDNIPPGNKNEPPAAAPAEPQGSAVVHAAPGQASPLQQQNNGEESRGSRIEADDKQFIIIVAVAVSTSFVGLMLAGVCYYKFRKSAKAASDVEYPVYGVTGPVKERIPSPGDRKLAQSAQMYHYQHQKQQMIAMEKANGDMKHDASDDDSEEDNIEGDYTVYECPGLAPTGEMEVRNPLFRADDTPVTPGEDITGQPHGQEPPPERGNQ